MYLAANRCRHAKGRLFLPWIGVLLMWVLPGISFAQTQSAEKEREYDSVYVAIYELLDEAKFTEAHDFTVKSLYTYRDDKSFVAALYLALSDVERITGNTELAFTHIRNAEGVMHSVGEDYWNLKKNTAYQRLANLYFETGKYDSAFVYAQEAMAAAQRYNPAQSLNMQMQNLPIVAHHYLLQGNYALAEKMYMQLLELNISEGYPCGNSSLYEKLAEIKTFQSKPKEAIAYVEKAYLIADTCGYSYYKLAAVNRSIWIYERLHDYKNMARYLQLKMKLLEETQLHEQKTRLQEMETQFGTKLKEEENKSLKAINREQETRNRFQWLLIGLSVLTLGVVSAFAFSYWKQKGRISKQKEDVERLNALNQKIFSVISHDFKGPMLGIDLLLGMHEKYGMDQETFTKQTALLRNDLSQANLVMENLLDWSKTELGFGGFQENTSEVAAVFAEVQAQLRLSIEQKKLTVDNRVPPENRLPVPPDILKIILRNLLSNAVKYSHEEGRIVFGYEPAANRYVLRDEGLGMDEQQLARLFVGRVGSRLGTRHESGYGIGLHLVHELVRKNNGRIGAHSVLNQGTSVYFTFD